MKDGGGPGEERGGREVAAGAVYGGSLKLGRLKDVN